MVGRSSCGPIACWILARTSSLVTWSLYEMHYMGSMKIQEFEENNTYWRTGGRYSLIKTDKTEIILISPTKRKVSSNYPFFNSMGLAPTESLLSKTHKRLEERFLIGRNRTKRTNFRGSFPFNTTYNIKNNNRKTNN